MNSLWYCSILVLFLFEDYASAKFNGCKTLIGSRTLQVYTTIDMLLQWPELPNIVFLYFLTLALDAELLCGCYLCLGLVSKLNSCFDTIMSYM